MKLHAFMRKTACASLLSLLLFITGQEAFAQGPDGGADPAAPHVSGGAMAGSLIWVIIALALVIGLILAVIKWLSRRTQAWGTNRAIRSHGGAQLGQNKSVQIVEAAGRIYVVGVGDTVTLLDKIEDPAQIEAMLNSLRPSSSGGFAAGGWAAWIAGFRNRSGAFGQERSPDASSFQSVLNRKLEQQARHREELETMWKDSNFSDRQMKDE